MALQIVVAAVIAGATGATITSPCAKSKTAVACSTVAGCAWHPAGDNRDQGCFDGTAAVGFAPTPPEPSCPGALPGDRRDCGFTKTEAECVADGCCWDPVPATYSCFYKSTECVVEPVDRRVCGDGATGKLPCEEKGCCYDDSKVGTFYCFHARTDPRPPGPPPPPSGQEKFIFPQRTDVQSCTGSTHSCANGLTEQACWQSSDYYSGVRRFNSTWTGATVTWNICYNGVTTGNFTFALMVDGVTVYSWTFQTAPSGFNEQSISFTSPVHSGLHTIEIVFTKAVPSGGGALTLGDWTFVQRG